MRRFLPAVALAAFFFFIVQHVFAQSNQMVTNGSATQPISFSGSGCTYSWINSNPSIGLAASGSGNIPSFKAVNTGSGTVTATITATPAENGFIFAANPYTNSVAVVNATTNAVVTTIQVGGGPTALSVSPDGSRLYVVNTESATVSVINTATDQVITTIPVGSYPYGIVVSPDGKTVYVTDQTSNSISVINTTSNTVTSTITLSQYAPWGISISPDGTKLFVADYLSNSISIVNLTNKAIQSVGVGTTPIGISTSSNTNLVYVANFGSNNVSVVNIQTNTVVATIPVGGAPMGVTISPDGSSVYVTNSGSNTVSVINTTTNQVTATIPVGQTPEGISVSTDGSLVYVFNVNNNTMSVINAATNSVAATSAVNNGQYSIGNFVTGCSPVNLTITVNPASSLTTTTATGNIAACAGTASASPNVQQFTVSGSNLTGGVTVTAPSGFEVSLSAASGYSSSITISTSGGTATNATVYVRSSASAAAGAISGNVTVSSTGASNQIIAVSGVVNALPTVNSVPNQTATNGAATNAVNFTGTGNMFTWTNDTPGIGLAASGTGNIPSFTAINTGSNPVTAQITVTSTNKQTGSIYMTNETTNQVSVLSNTTNNIISTINVGAGPYGIALSPNGSMAYVTNYIGNSVSVINTATNSVVTTVLVGYNPIGIATSPDGSKIYVCCFTGLIVIDATTNSIIHSMMVSNYDPEGITVSPDGKWIYLADPDNNGLAIINATTYQQTEVNFPTNITDSSFNVVTSPDGSLIYVTGGDTDDIFIINAATQKLTASISLTEPAIGIAISPDGKLIYVTNMFSNIVSVVNAVTGTLITTISVGSSPEGIAVSADGSTVYVANVGSNNMSIIDAATNQVIATVAAGATPHSLGNFLGAFISCTGPPVTFSVTVNPSVPTITATSASGTITTCLGTASASPNIQQFTVSGTNLTADITATAPIGFELSLTAANGYSSSITLSQVSGTLSSTIVYVRAAAGDAAGNISGTVMLSSIGVTTQQVAVSGLVDAAPVVNTVNGQTATNGTATSAIAFTGTAATYNWTNDTPAIGLAASGTGNIPSFTAINNTLDGESIVASITVTPVNGNGCSGTPVSFTITVNSAPGSVLSAQSTLTGLTTVYGTASAGESFHISGTNLTAGILVTAPQGFEVSNDGINYGATTLMSGTGQASNIKIFIRLASTTPVGDYTGNIVLSAPNAVSVNVAMPLSMVTLAPLTITADDKARAYGAANPLFTVTYSGFVNNETVSQLTKLPDVTTTATVTSAAGQYPITATGAVAGNYSFTYTPGVLTITPSAVTTLTLTIPNTFTPNGDGINDTWLIKNIDNYPKSTVNVFNRWGQSVFSAIGYPNPWDGTYREAALPSGTYYYIIDPKNGQAVFSGWLLIIR